MLLFSPSHSDCLSSCLPPVCLAASLARVLPHGASLVASVSCVCCLMLCLSRMCCPCAASLLCVAPSTIGLFLSLPPLIASRCSRCALAASRCLSPWLSLAVWHDDFIRRLLRYFLFKPTSSRTNCVHSLITLDLLTLHRT
jgi:hypothetical protein